MIKEADKEWKRYISQVSSDVGIDDPPFANNLDYIGRISAQTDYVPADEFIDQLREWLLSRNDIGLFYFLTEAVTGERTAFELEIQDLKRETLRQVNPGYQNLFVSKDFSWAIFINEEGEIHVAGNRDLFRTLEQLF